MTNPSKYLCAIRILITTFLITACLSARAEDFVYSSTEWVRLPGVEGGPALVVVRDAQTDHRVALLQCDRFKADHQYCSLIMTGALSDLCDEMIKGKILQGLIIKGVSYAMSLHGNLGSGLVQSVISKVIQSQIPSIMAKTWLPEWINFQGDDILFLIDSLKQEYPVKCPIEFDIEKQFRIAGVGQKTVYDGQGTLHDPYRYSVMAESKYCHERGTSSCGWTPNPQIMECRRARDESIGCNFLRSVKVAKPPGPRELFPKTPKEEPPKDSRTTEGSEPNPAPSIPDLPPELKELLSGIY